MNIFLALKCNFEKRAIFLNSNKIAKTPNKIKYDFFIKSSIFLYFGKVILFPLSYIFIIEIIEDKINKIKLSYFQNLIKLKYENNEIPNSLRGSLSCVELLGTTKMQIKYDMQ